MLCCLQGSRAAVSRYWAAEVLPRVQGARHDFVSVRWHSQGRRPCAELGSKGGIHAHPFQTSLEFPGAMCGPVPASRAHCGGLNTEFGGLNEIPGAPLSGKEPHWPRPDSSWAQPSRTVSRQLLPVVQDGGTP